MITDVYFLPSVWSAWFKHRLARAALCPAALVGLALTFAPPSYADQVIPDNLIVDGSHCVGPACADGEDFGFDTIRLKNSDPVLRFQDTSNAGAFPSNDWTVGVFNTGVNSKPQFKVSDDSSGQDVIILEGGTGAGVALGGGSTLEPAAVSFGAQGAERRVVHVEAGVEPTDAATLGQLDDFTSAAEAAVDAELAGLQSQLDGLADRVSALEVILQ